MPRGPLKLNLGCGSTKLPGYINIDSEKSCKPDLVLDLFKESLPYKLASVDEVVLFHTIEHIPKKLHHVVLKQVHRVLKKDGTFIISYPEWSKCATRWLRNHKGKRSFWEATLYGRQLYPSDAHVCIMDTIEFKHKLEENGFKSVKCYPEPEPNEFNTIVVCKKAAAYVNYEEMVLQGMKSTKILKIG